MPRPHTGPFSRDPGFSANTPTHRNCDICRKPTRRSEGGYVAIDKNHQKWVCNAKCKPSLEKKLKEAA